MLDVIWTPLDITQRAGSKSYIHPQSKDQRQLETMHALSFRYSSWCYCDILCMLCLIGDVESVNAGAEVARNIHSEDRR